MKKESKIIEMTPRQHTKVCRMIEKECCNFVDGICIIQDNGYGWLCPQMGTRILFCPWFRDAVLPLNPVLQNELLGDLRTRPCEMCGKVFVPGSNRARFCPKCGRKRRKLKEAERQRMRYHDSTHLGLPKVVCGADFRT